MSSQRLTTLRPSISGATSRMVYTPDRCSAIAARASTCPDPLSGKPCVLPYPRFKRPRRVTARREVSLGQILFVNRLNPVFFTRGASGWHLRLTKVSPVPQTVSTLRRTVESNYADPCPSAAPQVRYASADLPPSTPRIQCVTISREREPCIPATLGRVRQFQFPKWQCDRLRAPPYPEAHRRPKS